MTPEQRAREVLASEHERRGSSERAVMIRRGKVAGFGTPLWMDETIAAMLAFAAQARAEAIEEAAKVADAHSFGVEIGEWMRMTKKEISAHACRSTATTIRALNPPLDAAP